MWRYDNVCVDGRARESVEKWIPLPTLPTSTFTSSDDPPPPGWKKAWLGYIELPASFDFTWLSVSCRQALSYHPLDFSDLSGWMAALAPHCTVLLVAARKTSIVSDHGVIYASEVTYNQWFLFCIDLPSNSKFKTELSGCLRNKCILRVIICIFDEDYR